MTTIERVPLCEVCSRPIHTRFPSRRKGRRFCGWACAVEGRSGRNNYQWAGGQEKRRERQKTKQRLGPRCILKNVYWPEYRCDNCGAAFCRIRTAVRGSTVFCDSRCRYDFLRAHPTLGVDHPRFKGRKRQHYGTSRWRKLRREVLRQFSQCADCRTRQSLLVHHLLPIAEGGTDSYHNLVVLCRSCHMRWHRLGSQMRLALW